MERYKVYFEDELVYQSDNIDDAIEAAEMWECDFFIVDVIDSTNGTIVRSWGY